jgi:broad specificity phosphatase PhoE
MARLIFVSHPEVVVDPGKDITDWGLSAQGRNRAKTFAAQPVLQKVSHLWSSAERKAKETADILAAPRGLTVKCNADLGENDRSATGFLPPEQFQAAADAFFAHPDDSMRGWETARDAQARIARAVCAIVKAHDGEDLVIVSHGAVGTLLWCHLTGHPIDRRHDQPGQGHYWWADLDILMPQSGWQPIAYSAQPST